MKREEESARHSGVEEAQTVFAGLDDEVGPGLAVDGDDVAVNGMFVARGREELVVGLKLGEGEHEGDVVGTGGELEAVVEREVFEYVEACLAEVDVFGGVVDDVVVVPHNTAGLVVRVVVVLLGISVGQSWKDDIDVQRIGPAVQRSLPNRPMETAWVIREDARMNVWNNYLQSEQGYGVHAEFEK